MIFPFTDNLPKSANRKVRKLLGRAYLRENKINEALEVYQGILKDYPGDADVLLVLGNLYRLSGSPAVAERLYRQALETNPEDLLIMKQIVAVLRAQTFNEWETDDPLSGEAFSALASRLQAKAAQQQAGAAQLNEEIRSSADLPERRAGEDRAGEGNEDGQAAPLNGEMQQLMPALIAQNIRRARSAGFIELAESLQSLQIHLTHHAEDRWADDLLKDEPPPDRDLEDS